MFAQPAAITAKSASALALSAVFFILEDSFSWTKLQAHYFPNGAMLQRKPLF
jgi:hypothetical protein